LTAPRKQIAVNMQRALQEIPQVFSFEQLDATSLIEARAGINAEFESLGQSVTFAPSATTKYNATLNWKLDAGRASEPCLLYI